MHLKQFGWAAGLMLLASSVQAAPQPEIQELFKASRTPGDRVVAYPQGTPEMRVVRVGLPVGATIPLHTHPSPVVVVVTKGAMTNVRLVDGNEVVSVVRPHHAHNLVAVHQAHVGHRALGHHNDHG